MYKYIECLYFSVATLMLIGSKGETLWESIFLIIILIITVGAFAYIISTISKLFVFVIKF